MPLEAEIDPPLIPITVGVTGHRDIAHDQVHAIKQEICSILEDIRKRAPASPLLILSSLAEGADRLVVEVAAERFGAEYAAVLPRPAEDYRQDFQSPESVSEFDRLLARARYVTVQGSSAPLDSSDKETMNNAYLRAGAWVSLHSHVVIALWDGRPSRGLGGTADIVELRKRGRYPGFNDADPLQYAENGTTAQLVVRRSGEPASDTSCRKEWHYSDVELRYSETPSTHFHDSLTAIDRVNRLTRGIRTPLYQGGASTISHGLHLVSDALANRFQRRVNSTALILVAASLGALVSTALSNLPISIKIGCFSIGGLAWVCSRLLRWPGHHADFRAIAEALRIQVAWASARLPDAVADAYHPVQAMEVGWIRRVIRTAACLDQLQSNQNSPLTVSVPTRTPSAQDWIDSQIGYFLGKSGVVEKYRRQRRVLSFLGLLCGVAFFGMLGYGRVPMVLSSLQNADAVSMKAIVSMLVGIASGALAAVAALATYQSVVAIRELENSYATTAHLYAVIKDPFERATQTKDVARYGELLRAIGRAALVENTWWLLLRRQRQPRPPSSS